MMETYTGVSFPVVFYDGESETSIGNVGVYPTLGFKGFQSILSQKIGISPHQFSVYLADPRNPYGRVPITSKTNFAAISCETGCLFVVVPKRSRRGRRGKNQSHSFENEEAVVSPLKKEPPANAMLLRRDASGNGVTHAGLLSGYEEFERRLRDLHMQKQRYLATMGMANLRLDRDAKALLCEECEKAKELERDAGFHRCVYDAVTFGFRSPAGPIARPAKGSG